MFEYRNEKASISSDSSDDDDERDVLQTIRTRPKTASALEETLPNVINQDMEEEGGTETTTKRVPKRKVNPVWATVMSENLLSEDLGQFELKMKHFKNDRDVENYDYTGKSRFSVGKPEVMKIFTGGPSRRDGGDHDDERRCRDRSTSCDSRHKSYRKEKKNVVFSVEKEEAFKVARVIAAKLNEPNQKLIYRTVRVLGTKMTLETTQSVEEIEKNGGMKVLDGSRRRTPGGIYLYLLKSNPNIERHSKNYIFNECFDDPKTKFNKSRKKMNKKKSKKKSRKNSMQVDQAEGDSNLKPLPTKLDHLVSNENSSESFAASEEGETPNSNSSTTTTRSSSSASELKDEVTENIQKPDTDVAKMEDDNDEEVEDGEILD